MTSQAEEFESVQPDGEKKASVDAVRTRVSELLDNATVIPGDDVFEKRGVEDDDGDGTSVEARNDTSYDNDYAGYEDSIRKAIVIDDQAALPPAVVDEPVVEEADPDAGADESAGAETVIVETAAAETVAAETTTVTVEEEQSTGTDDVDSPKPVQVAASEPDEDILPSAVRIRGQPGGILVEIDEEGDWSHILKLLEKRLDAAEGFFRGGKAVLEVGPRDVYEDELRKARELLARHDMTLAVVRSMSDLTLQSSLLLGLSTSNVAARPVEPDREMAPVVPITQPKSPYFVHNGTLRSGQILRKSESVVVVGDVNPGAKVISGGDVMVWGRLRGVAYAGAGGNKKALVAAIEFAPTQLRIANLTAVAPDSSKSRKGLRFWKKEPDRRPEVAHIANDRIVVEPWDDSRPGRPRVARR